MEDGMEPRIVSRAEWTAARKALLAEEKAYTRQRDALNAKRQAMPWVKNEKSYVFDTTAGKKTLAELFGGRSQLIVNHFMLGPGWKQGCVVSSFGTDFNYDFHVSFTPEQIAKGKVDYNYSLTEGEEELPGISVFARNAAGEVFHTYSSFGRGAEELITTYMVLDLTPKGRNENGPHHNLMDWVKRHDEYEGARAEVGCCGS